jgi:glycosyltransferase involved in cell wall biosynthesis
LAEPLVTVVAPVYRNEATLAELHRRVAAALAGAGAALHLVLVSDASPDGSPAVIEALAAADPRVEPLLLERRGGQHRAVVAGLRRARGEAVVVLDADLQDPPEAIPALLAELRRGGWGAVYAGRRGRYESTGRLVTSRVFKRLLGLAAGIPADAGMFVAMTRAVADRVASFAEPRPFVVAMVGCAGAPTTSIPVARARADDRISGYTGWARLRTGLSALAQVAHWRRHLRGHHG